MFLGEGGEALNGIAEGTGIADLVPGQSRKTRCEGGGSASEWCGMVIDLLQSAVMGVLTGLTRTLSRCNWQNRSAM